MAPRRGNSNDGVIEIQITTPKDMSQGKLTKVKIKFTTDDFSITWLEFFRKHHKSLASFLQNKKDQYIVHDHRNSHKNMNVWMLNSTVKDYINSFKKTLSLYRATVAKRNDNMMPKPSHVGPARASLPTAATTNRSAAAGPGTSGRGSSNGTRNLPTPSAAMKRPAPPGNNSRVVKFPRNVDEEANFRVNSNSRRANVSPPRPAAPTPTVLNRNSFLNIDRDDICSMANSIDSQDSQLDELVQQGVEISDIKGKVIQNVVKHVDNVTMLRMKKELQSLIDGGRWLRITGRMPVTATALQLVFGLSTNTGR